MKRFWGHIWAAGIVAGIGGVILPACAHNDSSLFIRGVLFPPTFTPKRLRRQRHLRNLRIDRHEVPDPWDHVFQPVKR